MGPGKEVYPQITQIYADWRGGGQRLISLICVNLRINSFVRGLRERSTKTSLPDSKLAFCQGFAEDFFDALVVAFAGGADGGDDVGGEAEADVEFGLRNGRAAAAVFPGGVEFGEAFGEGFGAGEVLGGPFGIFVEVLGRECRFHGFLLQ